LDLIRRALIILSERLINSKFTESRRILLDALQDSDRIGELMALWEKSRPANLFDHRIIILAVDAVALRSNITITEGGEVRGLKNLKRLDDPDLFTRFLKGPPAFAQFLQNHCKETYSSMFAFRIQPVNPAFSCSIIRVCPDENEKGNPQTVEKLLALKNKLETGFGFAVLGLIFDGDFCFNVLHEEFMR
jgi:hypothetical protein